MIETTRAAILAYCAYGGLEIKAVGGGGAALTVAHNPAIPHIEGGSTPDCPRFEA